MIYILLSQDSDALMEYKRQLVGERGFSLAVHQFPETGNHPRELVREIRENIVPATMFSDYDTLIVTHSQTLVDYMGDLIEDGHVSKDDVEIRIIKKKFTGLAYEVSTFDGEGDLVNWPVGFFSGRV